MPADTDTVVYSQSSAFRAIDAARRTHTPVPRLLSRSESISLCRKQGSDFLSHKEKHVQLKLQMLEPRTPIIEDQGTRGRCNEGVVCMSE